MITKKDFTFEIFEESPRRRSDSELATITAAGNIYLNKKFRDAHWDDIRLDYVIFGYDRENAVICLQIVAEPESNSYPIREMADGKGLAVSARAFLNHYGIPFKKSNSYGIQYFQEYDEGEKGPYILIDLKKKV